LIGGPEEKEPDLRQESRKIGLCHFGKKEDEGGRGNEKSDVKVGGGAGIAMLDRKGKGEKEDLAHNDGRRERTKKKIPFWLERIFGN